jgi:hypothetical protein
MSKKQVIEPVTPQALADMAMAFRGNDLTEFLRIIARKLTADAVYAMFMELQPDQQTRFTWIAFGNLQGFMVERAFEIAKTGFPDAEQKRLLSDEVVKFAQDIKNDTILQFKEKRDRHSANDNRDAEIYRLHKLNPRRWTWPAIARELVARGHEPMKPDAVRKAYYRYRDGLRSTTDPRQGQSGTN